jgi:predicted AlkP superfamily phosphohydrolase/phosphomutase
MLIGLDGAEPTLVNRWMAEGRLPNLSKIAARGSFLPCASTTPFATFPAWTTCTTGVNPGQHGIIDFTRMKTGEYAIQFVNATARRAPAIWNTLSEAGKRCCVLGVPATYPPEPLNGVMVSGFDSPVTTGIDASFVYPQSEYISLKQWTFADFQESNIDEGWHDMALEKLLKGIDTKERMACDLLNREPWDFFMMVYGESDTVSHHFWMFHDPDSPRFRPGHENAIQQVYERLDQAVGKMMACVDDDVIIGIVSDHGFGGSGTGVVHLNNWLAENGYLKFAPDKESLLKKIAMTLTPESIRGKLFRQFEWLASKAESKSRFSGIDWEHTTAWSEELNYFPSIRINLKGREPQGQLDQSSYNTFVRELCAKLEAWEPIAHAWPRGDLYSGEYADRAPDIVVELALENGYSHSSLRARGGPAFRRLEPGEYPGGKERGMNGNHRDTGIFMWSDPLSACDTSLLDVAPTVYDAVGVQGPTMDGNSLLPPSTGTVKTTLADTTPESPYTPKQEAAIESRLRDLGYFE